MGIEGARNLVIGKLGESTISCRELLFEILALFKTSSKGRSEIAGFNV
jgi:hypothetical protein